MGRKDSKTPPLTLVGPDTTIGQPPRTLGKHGRSLWDRILAEYDVNDAADVEMLAQACAGADLAEQLHDEVERDGAVIRIRGAIRAHPAVKDEIAARAFVVRTLIKLGLNFEPVRASAGRPGLDLSWTGSR
jgi:terminase small subunit-like protein